jgi:hypothetical protein
MEPRAKRSDPRSEHPLREVKREMQPTGISTASKTYDIFSDVKFQLLFTTAATI